MGEKIHNFELVCNQQATNANLEVKSDTLPGRANNNYLSTFPFNTAVGLKSMWNKNVQADSQKKLAGRFWTLIWSRIFAKRPWKRLYGDLEGT